MAGSKKAEALWISWVLLLAFVVALSVFMFNWTQERNQVFANELNVMSDTAECDSVGIYVENICQNPQALYMNISNKNSIQIDQLALNIYDVYLENLLSREVNVSIYPSEKENVQVLKQATTQQLEIVPVVFTETDKIFCYKKTVIVNNIDYCI
ncbi:MAG: hypothetical protein ACOC32_02610 [Nanoarchaeota archaeon]